jgi:hypothetical protein
METDSEALVKSLLPRQWVTRKFSPDYGIDLIIEVFEYVDKEKEVCETLGEFLFVQLKSVKKVKIAKEKVYAVYNVAKVGTWIEDPKESIEIEVIKFVIDCDTLKSVKTTGNSICNLLFLADLDTSKVYFICLNDLIEKLIIPKSPSSFDKKNITISIPVKNVLNDKRIALPALNFYSKRAKLLSAFSTFSYQRNELINFFQVKDAPISSYRDELQRKITINEKGAVDLITHFIASIEDFDIWRGTNIWPPILEEYNRMLKLKNYLRHATDVKALDINYTRNEALMIWHRLNNLNNMYQEICREWFLPKYLSSLIS